MYYSYIIIIIMKISRSTSLLAVILLCCAAICASQNYTSIIKPLINPSSQPGKTVFIEDFSFTEYLLNGTQKKFTIEGQKLTAEHRRIGIFEIALAREMRLKDVEVTFYENDLPVSHLIAERATIAAPFRKKKQDIASALAGLIRFSGGVGLITADRRTLTCDALILDNRSGTIRASGGCAVGSAEGLLKSDSVASDVALRTYNIGNDRHIRSQGTR